MEGMPSPDRPDYDLVLVVNTFRYSLPYLNLVRALAGKLKIGLYCLPMDDNTRRKTSKTNELFLDACRRAGAAILDRLPVRTRLAIFPPMSFEGGDVRDAMAGLEGAAIWAMWPLSTGPLLLSRAAGLPIDRHLIVDRDYVKFRFRHHEAEGNTIPDETRMVEVGVPHRHHPLFDGLALDYIVAVPTPFSLPNRASQVRFLEHVLTLLDQIPADAVIALKPHNADEASVYFLSPGIERIVDLPVIRWLQPLLLHAARRVAGWLGTAGHGAVARLLDGLQIAILFRRILRRAPPLRSLTPYANFGIEAFLPHVRKGMISGYSNSVWHALYNRLPVYNAVDDAGIEESPHIGRMTFFVPPFRGARLEHDDADFDVVSDRVRERDLVAIVAQALEAPALPSRAPGPTEAVR
jgi:hypothetical protein